jgi:sulfonate transport system ATP-binding protein
MEYTNAPRDEVLFKIDIREKTFGGRRVLGPVRFTVSPGEVVGLIGPSGCGKSTLLRILAGLDREFDGEYALRGTTQHGPSSQIGVVFQEPRLLPWLTTKDNIAFSQGHRRGDDPKVARYLQDIGLEGKQNLLPKHLSGGMAQRVALARALFPDPALLLLDEPFSAVDALTRERLQVLLKTLTDARNTAILLVTHDLDEALYLSDRILILAPGSANASGAASLTDVTHGEWGSRITETFSVPAPHPRERDGAAHNALKRALFRCLAATVDV